MILMVMIMEMMIVQKHKDAKTILIYCVPLFIAAFLQLYAFFSFCLKGGSPREVATFEKVPATQLAEQLTFLEHLIFSKIPAQ